MHSYRETFLGYLKVLSFLSRFWDASYTSTHTDTHIYTKELCALLQRKVLQWFLLYLRKKRPERGTLCCWVLYTGEPVKAQVE